MEEELKDMEELIEECENHYQLNNGNLEVRKVLEAFEEIFSRMKMKSLTTQRNKLNREISTLKKVQMKAS